MDIRSLLTKYNMSYRISQDNALCDCPFCRGGDNRDKETFAVSLDTGAWVCYRGKCGKSGSLYDLKVFLGEDTRHSFHSTPVRQWNKPPKIPFVPLPDEAKEWLYSRKLTEDALRRYKITSANGSIAFPFFRNGKLQNVQYRSKGDKGNWKSFSQEKGCRPCLFGADLVDTSSDTLFITEGMIDAISLYIYGYTNSVSIPSGSNNKDWIEEEWEWLSPFKKIYLLMDNDDAGAKAIGVFSQRLGLWRCKIVDLPHKDVNECLMKGISPEEFKTYIDSAREIQHERLKRVLDFEGDVIDIIENPNSNKGLPIKLKELDFILKGWRDGEVTIWTGYGGAGKSTLLGQLCIDLASQGVASCVASMELPAKRYLSWQVQQMIDGETVTIPKAREVLAWLNNYQLIANYVGTAAPSELLEIFEFAARKYNCKHFVVDSLMRVELDNKDKYEAQKKFVSQMCEFAKTFNCHIHLVAHPRKGETDNYEPGKVDVGGSSAITDLADNVVITVRTMQDGVPLDGISTGHIYVRKNREFGFLGKFEYVYNAKTRRFSCKTDSNPVSTWNTIELHKDDWRD